MSESRYIAWPAYLVSVAMILLPLSDVATSLYPWRFVDPRWRFGAVGLVSNALILPMAGLLLGTVTSVFLEQFRVRRVIGVLSLLGAATCLLAIAMFALDSVQTRATVAPEMRLSFAVASIAAVVKTLFACATFLAIGLSAIRARRGKAPDAKHGVLFKVDATPAQSRS